VFLDEGREEDYVDFLEVRKIEMEELEIEKLCVDDEKLFQGTRDWVLKDRARHDKAVLAYVSFIRYYSKHTASSIFRLQTLDYLGLAKMYGVLRLPKMPEIKQFLKDSPDGGVFNIDIDFKEYKYLNPKKEEARLEELANEAKKYEELTKKKEKAKENSSWSNRNGGVKGEKTERFLQRELKKRKADLGLKDSDDEEDQETDWKDLVKKSKREKKSSNEGIAQFDDL
jgi:ATP-dependent RNA helicase DDX55/SPB4